MNLPRLTILVAKDVQRAAQSLGTAEEHTRLARSMQFPDTPKDHIPVRTAKVRRRPQAGNGILIGVGIIDHNVGRIVNLDLGRQVRVDLDAVVDILGFDSQQKRAEPLERAEISADPEEVHLAQPRLLLRVVHAIPDRLEDGGEGGHADTGTDQDGHLVLEHVFGGGAERSIDVHTGKNTAESGINFVVLLADTDDLGRVSLLLVVEFAPQSLGKLPGKITDDTYVDRDVVLLWCAREGEGMVLPQGNSRAAKEDVLAGASLGVLLLDLDLAHVAGVLDNLGDVRLVLATDLAGNALGEIGKSSVHPVLPEHTDGRGADRNAERREVGLDHAEGTVDGPEKEEDDEHVVRVPEPLVVRPPCLFDRSDHHASQRDQHDIASPTGTRDKVGQQPAVDTEVVLGCNLGEVVPVGNGVHPRPEEDGPCRRDVEGNVLVELDDAVQRSLSCERDERSTDREKDQGNIDVQNQRCRSCNHVCRSKRIPRYL